MFNICFINMYYGICFRWIHLHIIQRTAGRGADVHPSLSWQDFRNGNISKTIT